MAYNIKSIKKDFKAKGIFYTPPELAELVKSYIPFKPKKVYDPTCGDGGLLAVFDDDIPKFGQEINDHQLDVAKERLVNFIGYCGDTLKDNAFSQIKFDCIVANPPFSINWEPNEKDVRFKDAPCIPTASRADFAFLLHILYHLADDGVAAVLCSPGVLYRGNCEGKIRQWFVDNNYISKVIAIPGKTFEDTAIPTALIVLDKSGKSEDIEFTCKETNESRLVTKAEIIDNDYTLSVSNYIQKKNTKEDIDIIKTEEDLKASQLRILELSFEIDALTAEIDNLKTGNPKNKAHLENIINLTSSYKNKKPDDLLSLPNNSSTPKKLTE